MITLNGYKITPTIFPDKTSQVWNLPSGAIKEENQIVWEFESEGEIMHLSQLAMLILASGATARLHMPYLPYARQDKPVSNITSFALFPFATLINTMKFDAVTFIDAHSFVATNWIEDSHNIDPMQEIMRAITNLCGCGGLTVVYPDQGASERYEDMLDDVPLIDNAYHATKQRNQQTGGITSMILPEDAIVAGQQVLIVDDLCDGGMTFKILAEELMRRGAKDVHLYVSHGLFSKGLETLRESGVKRIFTLKGEVK